MAAVDPELHKRLWAEEGEKKKNPVGIKQLFTPEGAMTENKSKGPALAQGEQKSHASASQETDLQHLCVCVQYTTRKIYIHVSARREEVCRFSFIFQCEGDYKGSVVCRLGF